MEDLVEEKDMLKAYLVDFASVVLTVTRCFGKAE